MLLNRALEWLSSLVASILSWPITYSIWETYRVADADDPFADLAGVSYLEVCARHGFALVRLSGSLIIYAQQI